MPSPVAFMNRYRNLAVQSGFEDESAGMSRRVTHRVKLRKYFMMNWAAGTEQRMDYDFVRSGSRKNRWFATHAERIKNAAMGKGAPGDYELALQWAILSGKISDVGHIGLQTYCDQHLGIDCSGFVTNYLIACMARPITNVPDACWQSLQGP